MILAYTQSISSKLVETLGESQGEFHKILHCVPHVVPQYSNIPVGFCTPLLMESEEWGPTDCSGS